MRAVHPVTPRKKLDYYLTHPISHSSDGKSGVVSADVIVTILLVLVVLGELVTDIVALFGIQKSFPSTTASWRPTPSGSPRLPGLTLTTSVYCGSSATCILASPTRTSTARAVLWRRNTRDGRTSPCASVFCGPDLLRPRCTVGRYDAHLPERAFDFDGAPIACRRSATFEKVRREIRGDFGTRVYCV